MLISKKSGNLNMGFKTIENINNSSSTFGLVRKGYIDSRFNQRILKTGDTMSGNLSMTNNKITGLADPTSRSDAVSKSYVDIGLNNKLDKTISSDLDMKNN